MTLFYLSKKSDKIFEIKNDMIFLNVLDENNIIDLKILLINIIAFIEKHDKIIINISHDMSNREKLKIVLLKNLTPRISYIIS